MRLSVCVPTYNFGAFIGDTLVSILSQLEDGVEVVVLDGGSTDNTSAVVESLQAQHANLRYERRDERGGIDRDMARTVDMATGEYCWLFCADDIMKPGAIHKMLQRLDSGCDVYLCGMTLCDKEMRELWEHPVSSITTEAQFELSREDDRRRYFGGARTTTAFFSFAGSIVFRKARWDEVGLDEDFVGSLWAHVARFFAMIPAGLRLQYLPESYLFKRTGNDSFMDGGLINRYAIAVDGYDRLAKAFFGAGGWEVRDIHRVLANEFPPLLMLELKFNSKRDWPDEVAVVDRMAAKAYGEPTPRAIAYRLIYNYTPRAAYRSAQAAFRALKAMVAALRRPRRAEPRAAGR